MYYTQTSRVWNRRAVRNSSAKPQTTRIITENKSRPRRWMLEPPEILNLLLLNAAEKLESWRIKVPGFTSAFFPKWTATNKPKVSQWQWHNSAVFSFCHQETGPTENVKYQGERMSLTKLILFHLILEAKKNSCTNKFPRKSSVHLQVNQIVRPNKSISVSVSCWWPVSNTRITRITKIFGVISAARVLSIIKSFNYPS